MTISTRRRARPPNRRPGGRSARVQQAVFAATLKLLADQGYPSLSIEAVAEAAGVNKTTIYRNWPTKAKLVLGAAADRSASAISIRKTGDLERDLRRLLSSVASYTSSPVGRALLVAALNGGDEPTVKGTQREFWETRFAAARKLFDIDPGNPEDVGAADETIEHLIAPVFLRLLVTGQPLDRKFIERTAHLASGLAERDRKE
jgi:AcrR family transcriptional regulator